LRTPEQKRPVFLADPTIGVDHLIPLNEQKVTAAGTVEGGNELPTGAEEDVEGTFGGVDVDLLDPFPFDLTEEIDPVSLRRMYLCDRQGVSDPEIDREFNPLDAPRRLAGKRKSVLLLSPAGTNRCPGKGAVKK